MAQRTCIGCRNVFEKSALIRFVADSGVVKPDFSGGKDGRGAYLCPKKECVRAAYKKKEFFSKAFRCKIILSELEDIWLSILSSKAKD